MISDQVWLNDQVMNWSGNKETIIGSSSLNDKSYIPRLKTYESQWQDQDQDWKALSLTNETGTENVWICGDWYQDVWVSMTRPGPLPIFSESQKLEVFQVK